MKRELDDERHELCRNEMRELWREGCQQFRAVGLLVRLEAARGIYCQQVGVRPVSSVMICVLIGIFTSRRQNRARP